MAIAPLVDAIRTAVPVPTGVERIDSLSEPVRFVPDRCYAWAMSETLAEMGGGELDEGQFRIAIVVTLASSEQALGEGDRAISLALDAAMDAVGDWVRAHRADTTDPRLWEDLQVASIAYDLRGGVRGFEYRGHRAELNGYRQISS